LSCQFGIALVASLRIPIFNCEIATVDPTEFAEPQNKSGNPLAINRRVAGTQESDGRQLARLLRARRERERRRATAKRDELAALHSITSSARSGNAGGMFNPSTRAVLRLTTSSYLVGACTGNSPGFCPRRMRST